MNFDRHRELFNQRRFWIAWRRWKILNWKGMKAAAEARSKQPQQQASQEQQPEVQHRGSGDVVPFPERKV
jgi:hypothetical protein